jgi:hypothetical protein
MFLFLFFTLSFSVLLEIIENDWLDKLIPFSERKGYMAKIRSKNS